MLFGQVRKCLVLDCDGTLWGGIVGEDGLDGIKVSAAYQAFQREALNLRRRGVMLAICSKNNEPDVLEVLREHPDMLLREEHFVATQINWDDKATNLRRIAEELNIGIDALVFADDNAFECDFIRQAVPDVAVLHVSGDPSGFRTLLTDRAFFDTPTLSAEDAKRSEMMAAERTRKQMVSSAESLEDYLRSLEIVATIGVPGPREIGRVAQLTQKTNQFNLTTRRYTEGDIERFLAAPDMGVYYLKLRDKVSDIGLIGVAITRPQENGVRLEIDTFLMSCRALGRGAEDALIARIAKDAAMNGYREIVGSYLPTKKNGQVADFYAKRGFAKLPGQGEGTSWSLDLGGQGVDIPDWIHLTDGTGGGDGQ
ncbi:MAG: HAD-IIIC family phosphatase [Rhodospirillales bacterium]